MIAEAESFSQTVGVKQAGNNTIGYGLYRQTLARFDNLAQGFVKSGTQGGFVGMAGGLGGAAFPLC